MLTNRALASTTFVAGPEDSLATPDVYDIQSDAVINDLPIPDSIADTDDIADEMIGGSAAAAGLPGLTSITSSNPLDNITIDGKTQSQLNIENSVLIDGVPVAQVNPDGSWTKLTSSDSSSTLLDSIKQYGSAMSKAIGGVAGAKALANMSGPTLLTRLASGTLSGVPGLGTSGVASLASTLRNTVMPSEVQKLFNTAIPSVLGTYSSVGGTTSKVNPANISSSYQMSSLINSVLGTPTTNVVDKDGTARLIAGLSMGGASTGMNNSFSTLVPLAGGDQSIINAAAQASLRYCTATGNTGSLKDIVNAVGPTTLLCAGKLAIKSFSTNYNPSASSPPTTQAQLADFSDITNSFGSLDPTWLNDDHYKIDPTTGLTTLDYSAMDLSTVCEGSSDFTNTMVTGAINSTDSDQKFMAVAAMSSGRTPEAELARNFPLTTTSVTSSTTGGSITTTTDAGSVTTQAANAWNQAGFIMNYNSQQDYVQAQKQGYVTKGISGFDDDNGSAAQILAGAGVSQILDSPPQW